MPKFDLKELVEIQKEKDRLTQIDINVLMNRGNFIDEDGYPTFDAAWIIEHWVYPDLEGWFRFIKTLWHLSSYGWSESVVPSMDEDYANTTIYKISTIGWSGNEALIKAMQNNMMCWEMSWYESRRGGHYIFEVSN